MTTRRAFSLVEVMVSSTLLVVGIAAIILGANVAISLQEHQRRLGHALIVGERRMEALLLLAPGDDGLKDGRHPGAGFEEFSEEGRIGGNAFRVSYVVTDLGNVVDGVGGKTIALTVKWTERVGERELTLNTRRGK